MPTAVQFGAGNIGRGFIAQLFHESGFEVVFVDVQADLLEQLNRDNAYTIHIVGDNPEDVRIDNVRVVDGRDIDQVAAELDSCEIACTAVGANALPHIAAPLAMGLSMRSQTGRPPLNILICENLHGAADRLRGLVADQLSVDDRDRVLAATGFVHAVVSRMVPIQDSRDLPDIRVEAYKRLPVDGQAIVGSLPDIVGVEPVINFPAYEERKLYTHNCLHATLGYLGYESGIEFGWQALKNTAIFESLSRVSSEVGFALTKRHDFSMLDMIAHVNDLLKRFANRELGDTCFRLARDPIRKLAPHDRLVGAARLCESQSIKPIAFPRVIASALRFDAADDSSAVDLQNQIKGNGIEAVLSTICGIRPDEPLGEAVLAEYDR